MTHGLRRNEQYRDATKMAVSVPLSGRTTCTNCGKFQSDGQFAVGEKICITCKPQGPNFRRGQLDNGVKAQFSQSEISMDIESKALRMIGDEPKIRSMQLMDRINVDFADLEPVLVKLIAEGKIAAHRVEAPNGRPATGYTLSEQACSDAPDAAPSFAMTGGSKVETAIRYIRANDGATSSQLHTLLGLAANVLVSRELASALADGRLVKDGKNWSLGIASTALPLDQDKNPAYEPAAPRSTKPLMAVQFLLMMPLQRCTQEQMRMAIGLAPGAQPGPYLKSLVESGRLRRDGTDWILALTAQEKAEPTPPAAPPAPPPDEHEAQTFAPLGGIGDVNSQEKGSGARYNTGKPPFELVPAAVIGAYFGGASPEGRALALLGQWQEGGNQETLVAVLRELGDDGWSECANVFDYGRKKYAAWNWTKGMPWSAPLACAKRHLLAMIAGQALDPESGYAHRGHVFCNIVMLWIYHRSYLVGDDRPIKELQP